MRKRKASEEPVQVEQGPTPEEIGLHGSVDDLYQADKAAEADKATKKAAYEKHDKRTEGISIMFCSLKKNSRLREAYRAAEEVPYQIRQGLQQGAFQAFLEGRHENLQEILSHPEAFRGSQYEYAEDLVIKTLIKLTSKLPTPETPLLALAKVDEDKRQDILDNTLYTIVWGYHTIEEVALALLRAGAKADHGSSRTLAAAFINQHDGIVDMLKENGANVESAIATMRANTERYGDSADRIEHLEFKEETQARIRDLERKLAETTRELTGGKPQEPSAVNPSPAPAKTATRLRMPSPPPQ